VKVNPDPTAGGNLVPLFKASMEAGLAGRPMSDLDPALFSSSASFSGYIQHASKEHIKISHLGFFADCLPPPVVQLPSIVGNWVPTLQLSVYFRGTPLAAGQEHISKREHPFIDSTAATAPEWLRFVFKTRMVMNGLCEIDGELWDETDSLVGQSRQLARIIPPPKR
jgi:hypothetical protein